MDKATENLIDSFDDLEPTEYEKQEHRHRLVTADNERRVRVMRARSNRRNHSEIPAPKVGTTYYVSLARGLIRRNRAGVKFEAGVRVEVKVVDGDEAELRQKNHAGATPALVTINGAEEIIEDDALTIYPRPELADEDVTNALLEARARNAALEQELKTTRAEAAQLREARMNAKDEGDGKPARLMAQAQAREAAAAGKPAQSTAAAPAGKPKLAADEDFAGTPEKK